MKRSGFTFLEVLVLLVILVIVAAILFPIFARKRDWEGHPSCQSNMKQIGLGLRQYTQDYNEHLPPIRVHAVAQSLSPFEKPYGWADAIYPYLKAIQLFQCPSQSSSPDGTQDAVANQFTDYYYNSNLDGIHTESVVHSETTVLLGDGNDGTDAADARYNRNVIPKFWLDDSNSPARRHQDGANYAFVDGHAKWLKPELVKAIRTNKSDDSFAVK